MKLKPLNNHLLVELVDEFAGIRRPQDDTESLQKGIVRDISLTPMHLTMSAGLKIPSQDDIDWVNTLKGKVVYWQEHADAGQKLPGEDGKQYALIPFWRLIAVEAVETVYDRDEDKSSERSSTITDLAKVPAGQTNNRENQDEQKRS